MFRLARAGGPQPDGCPEAGDAEGQEDGHAEDAHAKEGWHAEGVGDGHDAGHDEKDDAQGDEVMAKAKLGSGARFKAVMKSAAASGASNPAAVAAAVGRKKYGAARMAKMAAAGRRKG